MTDTLDINKLFISRSTYSAFLNLCSGQNPSRYIIGPAKKYFINLLHIGTLTHTLTDADHSSCKHEDVLTKLSESPCYISVGCQAALRNVLTSIGKDFVDQGYIPLNKYLYRNRLITLEFEEYLKNQFPRVLSYPGSPVHNILTITTRENEDDFLDRLQSTYDENFEDYAAADFEFYFNDGSGRRDL